MIRWRYVITRLAIVAVVLLLIAFGLGPVAGYVTAKSLEEATGAKVEIGHTTVGLFPPTVQYNDFRVADPRDDKEMKDAFRAESIELEIDGSALLRRRWVANTGRITGIQVGTKRESSGHLAEDYVHEVDAEDSAGMLGTFLSGATDQLGDHADAVIGGLETVRRSKEIRARWESEYDNLVKQARGLELEIREIRDSAKEIDNPLRDWQILDRTLARASATRSELNIVRNKINTLPDQMQEDLASLQRAKQMDMDKIDQYVPGSLSQSDNFGVDLMAKAVREQIATVRGYLDGGRAIADYTVVAPENERARGVDYDLLGVRRRPDIMVRHCEVSGLLRSDNNAYVMTGIVENLTPSPERLAEPTRTRLRLEGPEVIRVELVSDRRQGADVDTLTLHWPQTDADPMHLGNPRDAGISIMGGQRELWVQLQSRGEHIEGRFVSRQDGLKMKLEVDSKYKESPAAISLGQSLAAVDKIEVEANFAGTWRDLSMQLNTNIGQIFKNAAREAVVGQMEASKRQLATKIEEAHLREALALRDWMGTRQTEAQTLLASADESIKEMRSRVVKEVGEADAYLGKHMGKLRSAIEGRLR